MRTKRTFCQRRRRLLDRQTVNPRECDPLNGDKPASLETDEKRISRPQGTDMKFLQLLSPCLFGHGDTLRTRDAEGYLALQCADCGQITRLFEQPVIKGPKHDVQPVKGAPIVRVRRVGTR